MTKPRSFLCGGLKLEEGDPLRNGRHVIELSANGQDRNVHIRLMDLSKEFKKHIAPRMEDLLEIASYVYAADCSTHRGGHSWTEGGAIEPWKRDFQFIFPVRDLDFWNQDEVKNLLQVLQFLSQDSYSIVFRQMSDGDGRRQDYLEFKDDEEWPFHDVDRVLMFSGGLDSLAGAVETAKAGEKLVLVSHWPTAPLRSRQDKLFAGLKQLFSAEMIHIPVWIYKDGNMGREHTQRTRSFLYSALGAIVASSIRGQGVRFFENGIVSLNLPVADEVIGSRASRTTHPLVMDLFSKLYTLVLGRDFVVDNPYIFDTKSEVIERIVKGGGGDLIGYTCSCARPMFKSKTRWHCGTCSQCIDRKVAIVAAGQEGTEPDSDYVVDVFTGPRMEGYDQNIAVDYVRHGRELAEMSEETMASKFNAQLTRACRPFPKRAETARRFIEMHMRHGQAVKKVIESQFKTHAGRFFQGDLPPSSLLARVGGQAHQTPLWRRYAERLVDMLRIGLPKICETDKPDNELRLQEICDGILTSNGDILVREFPYMCWGSNTTKPDWMAAESGLLVELKYVRRKSGISKISKDIAEDLTKYGDNGRRVLFVVYDPDRVIIDEAAFMEPVQRREDMLISILR